MELAFDYSTTFALLASGLLLQLLPPTSSLLSTLLRLLFRVSLTVKPRTPTSSLPEL